MNPVSQASMNRATCVFLVFNSVVSFRSVPRILTTLTSAFVWIPPHFTSVINWSLRVGLARMKSIGPIKEQWLAIIDCSIDIGVKKVLVVLRVKMDSLLNRDTGLTLKDCECIGVKTAINWNGDSVSTALSEIFKISGSPTAILKDEGGDLKRGVTLYSNKTTTPIFELKDVGHFTANSLKAEYGKDRSFRQLLDLVSRISSQLKHSVFGFLMAPSLGNHSRFLRITKTVSWCNSMVELLKSKKIPFKNIDKKLRKGLCELITLAYYIDRLAKSCDISDRLLKLLKTKGLNETNYQVAKVMLNDLPKTSIFRARMAQWLNDHIEIYRHLKLENIPLIVSSDIIESLMGKFKTIIQRCPRGEFNHLILLLPCLCGELSESSIYEALIKISHSQLKIWEKENISTTMRQSRHQFFEKFKLSTLVPKTRNNSS